MNLTAQSQRGSWSSAAAAKEEKNNNNSLTEEEVGLDAAR
jgi:hypothetical protein